MDKAVRGSCSEAVAPDEQGGPGLMWRSSRPRMKRGVRGSCTGGAITRGWGGLRDTGDRRTAGPAQPIMVESEHPLDDPRGVGRAVDPPPTGPDDPVEVGPYRVLGRLGAVGMAAALAGIHAAEVVHRDLKPGNVLLSYFGPRVIDFGIARALDDASTAITRVGTVMGTPAWMAPEQFGNAPVTTAADIFAWGGLVAYAGTGRLAFGRGPVEVLAYRIVHQPPDLDGLAEPLRPLVELAMAKDPARRPSARALLAELLDDPSDPGTVRSEVTKVLQRTWVKEPVRTDPAERRPSGRPAAEPAAAGSTTPARVASSQRPRGRSCRRHRSLLLPCHHPGGRGTRAPVGSPPGPSRAGRPGQRRHDQSAGRPGRRWQGRQAGLPGRNRPDQPAGRPVRRRGRRPGRSRRGRRAGRPGPSRAGRPGRRVRRGRRGGRPGRSRLGRRGGRPGRGRRGRRAGARRRRSGGRCLGRRGSGVCWWPLPSSCSACLPRSTTVTTGATAAGRTGRTARTRSAARRSRGRRPRAARGRAARG